MSLPAVPAVPGFRVLTAGTPQVMKDAAGKDGVCYVVSWQTDDGTQGELWVPEAHWSYDQVEELVKADIMTTWQLLHPAAGGG